MLDTVLLINAPSASFWTFADFFSEFRIYIPTLIKVRNRELCWSSSYNRIPEHFVPHRHLYINFDIKRLNSFVLSWHLSAFWFIFSDLDLIIQFACREGGPGGCYPEPWCKCWWPRWPWRNCSHQGSCSRQDEMKFFLQKTLWIFYCSDLINTIKILKRIRLKQTL